MNTRIIVDSTSDLYPELKSRVHVMPLTLRFGEEEYLALSQTIRKEYLWL